MIKINNVSKSFDGISAVDNVSIDIEYDSSVVISGPSGSGKSTLLRLIAGLETPDKGTIEINGKCMSAPGLALPPYKRRIGYMFQSHALWPHMTILENIRFPLYDISSDEATKRAKLLLDRMEILHLADRKPDTISGGEARRVALARALAPKPEILLMDEPLSNLNHALKREMLDLITQWRSETRSTLVYVTHEEQEARHILSSLFRMEKGTLTEDLASDIWK